MDLRGNMIGFRTMLIFSSRKLVSHRRWLLAVALGALVCAVMGYGATQDMANIDTASDMMDLLLLTFLLPVLALIYGASMIRNEMDDRSIIQVITSPLDRRTSYLGYYLALTIVLAVLLSIITALGGVSFFVMNGEEGAAGLVLAFMYAMCIGAVVYSALFLVLGVVLKQPIYLGLFYVFIWEGFVGSLQGAIGQYTIRHQLRVIVSDMVSSGSIAKVEGDAGTATVILVVLTVVLLVLGAYAFREKEMP